MSIKGQYLASSDKDEVFKVKDTLEEMAKGGKPGIESKVYSKQDIDAIKQKMKSFEQELEQKKTPARMAKACLAGAAYRNVEYVQSGRKFMRISGMSGRVKAMWGRGLVLTFCEEATKK